MQKSILFALLCGVAVFAVACGGGNNTGNKPSNSSNSTDSATGDNKADAADAYALYKKKGRSWTLKNVTKMAGMDDMVSYMKTEVTDVNDKEATITTTMMDKDKKPMAGMEPTKSPIPFATTAAAPAGDAPKVETKEEKIKVEAGEFECIVTEMSGTKSWTSKEFPGLTVKVEHAGGTSELVEFNK